MKIKHLIYTGRKESGTITVKQLNVLHPLRRLEYVRNQKWRLEYDIPEQIAMYIKTMYPLIFRIVEEEMADIDVFTSQYAKFIETYGSLVSPEDIITGVLNCTIDHLSKEIKKKDLFDFSFNTLMDKFDDVNKDVIVKVITKKFPAFKKQAKKN